MLYLQTSTTVLAALNAHRALANKSQPLVRNKKPQQSKQPLRRATEASATSNLDKKTATNIRNKNPQQRPQHPSHNTIQASTALKAARASATKRAPTCSNHFCRKAFTRKSVRKSSSQQDAKHQSKLNLQTTTRALKAVRASPQKWQHISKQPQATCYKETGPES